jgi:hypothetical protein
MIEVKLDDRTIEIEPYLTVAQYQELMRYPDKYKDPTHLLSLYLGITTDELSDLPFEQIKFVNDYISGELIQHDADKIVFTFQLDGITYGLENKWHDLKWGQWTNLEVYSQKDRINENIHILLALLYRPIEVEKGEKYTLSKFKTAEVLDRAALFQDKLSIQIWFSVAAFFLLISEASISSFVRFTKWRMRLEKVLKPMRKILPKWALPKPLPASTFNLLSSLPVMTSQNTNS